MRDHHRAPVWPADLRVASPEPMQGHDHRLPSSDASHYALRPLAGNRGRSAPLPLCRRALSTPSTRDWASCVRRAGVRTPTVPWNALPGQGALTLKRAKVPALLPRRKHVGFRASRHAILRPATGGSKEVMFITRVPSGAPPKPEGLGGAPRALARCSVLTPLHGILFL